MVVETWSKEALLLVQKKNILIRYQRERDKARMLQRLGGSRAIRNGFDTQDTLSVESCMSSVACDMEELSSESSRKMQDKEETTSEVSGTAFSKRKKGWRLEPEGETETTEVTVWWDEAEGVAVTPESESLHEQTQVKSTGKEREGPGEEGEDIESPTRKLIRVESEETQDYVKETLDLTREKARERSFVPSAISVPQFKAHVLVCDNRCK